MSQYDDFSECREGLVRVRRNGRYGFIDKRGKVVIPCKYRVVDLFSEGLAAVGKNDEEEIPENVETQEILSELDVEISRSF